MKVLIIGLGSIARKHISAIRSIYPDAQIDALRSGASSHQMDGVNNVFSLPEPFDYDFIIISNPTSCHASTIDMVANSRIPLFIEKPLFSNLDHKRLVDRIMLDKTITYVGCNLRFLDSLVFLNEKLKTDSSLRVNEINAYCGSFLPEWRKSGDFRNHYSVNPEAGGGVHLDLIHEIDYLVWLFGLPLFSKGLCRNNSSLDIEAFDYANYCLIYESFVASVILDYYRRDAKRTLEIVFNDSTWTVNLLTNRITDSSDKIIFESDQKISDTYLQQMKYFIDGIKNNSQPQNNIFKAFQILKIALDYERS